MEVFPFLQTSVNRLLARHPNLYLLVLSASARTEGQGRYWLINAVVSGKQGTAPEQFHATSSEAEACRAKNASQAILRIVSRLAA